MRIEVFNKQMRTRVRQALGGALVALLACGAGAQSRTDEERKTMPSLAELISNDRWADARTYVAERQNAALPEIWEIVSDPQTDSSVERALYSFLREVRTLQSAMMLAYGVANGAREHGWLGLAENPRPEVYPVLKARLQPPEEERRKALLLTMAQMPVSVEQRIDDLWPYLDAKNFDARHGAMLGLALLDEPAGMEDMIAEMGTKDIYIKQWFLRTFYMFPAWRIPKFVPFLIPILNDPTPLVHIGIRQYNRTGGETELTPIESRYKRAHDFALNIIVAILKLEVPFRIADYTTYTAEQREIVKQKLRELGYKVTDEPYPVTPP